MRTYEGCTLTTTFQVKTKPSFAKSYRILPVFAYVLGYCK